MYLFSHKRGVYHENFLEKGVIYGLWNAHGYPLLYRVAGPGIKTYIISLATNPGQPFNFIQRIGSQACPSQ